MEDTFDPRPDRDGSTGRRPALEVVRSDDPAEGTTYTFVPRGADDAERLTAWMAADRDGVVSLENWQ